MLAEENKSAGPSALDGKPAEIFFFLLSIFFSWFLWASLCFPHSAFHSASLRFNVGVIYIC